MVERRLSVVDAASPMISAVDVVVRSDGDTPLAQVRDALAQHAPAGAPLFVGTSLFPDEGTFGEVPLVDGDRISWNGPVQPAAIERRWTRWELRVVGGPAAGRVVPLPPGRHEVGRSGSLVAFPEDDLMSRHHLALTVEDGSVSVEDVGSANGTYVEGEEARGPVTLTAGTVVQAGATLLQVVPATTPDLELVPQPDGRRGLNRRFRVGDDELPGEVGFPTRPEPGERPGMSILIMLAPAVLIGAMVLVLDFPPTMLAFMAMSPVIGIGGAMARRKQHDKKVARDFERFREAAASAKEELLDLRRQETEQLRRRHPDPAAAVQCARAAGRLLWSRRGGDADLLDLRVGSGSRRSGIRAQNAETDDATLWMGPVTVSLPAVGGVGLVGDLARARGLARSMVLQAATYHSPAEVRVVVLSDGDEGADAWGWTRWLPHARWSSDEDFVLVGSDPLSTRGRLEELKDLIARRKEARNQERKGLVLPTVLVVYDGVAKLLALGFAEVLREGPEVGVFALSVDEVQVPEGCNASVTFGADGDDARLEQAGRPAQEHIVVDAVDVDCCSVAARCLAPLKVIGEEAAVELPPQLRLLDLLDLEAPTGDAVGRMWSTTSRNPGAPVGLTTGGPLMVDLTRDGPHGIIAGASRSGKSEFLKTFIASLAARNHPDDLSFLFIDFKGGNDYQVAATLPHTVDLATQIDRSGFERSLQLLDAEILRRQQIAGSLQTSTLEGYWSAQASRPPGSTPVMGRLVVIVDEFAELAQKNPEQLERLVSVARVGAAYGVHLILATQRPAGVVSGQIDANAPLRVCFRTTAKEHSSDVLGSALAADIAERHRGRGYKKAHQESPTEFQCARVGNARPGSVAATPLRVVPEPWATLGHIPPEEQGVGEVPDPETDFYDLALAIREAAATSGWQRNAVPWPKPLPSVVELGQLPASTEEDRHAGAIPFAVLDDPDRQAHLLATVELGAGHVAFAGSSGTGRTTALRSIAASAASALSPAELHLYAIDVSSGGLSGLSQLPHCGGVATTDPEVTGRILDHVESQIRARRTSFEAIGASDLGEHNARSEGEPLPWILLLVDGWDVLHEESQTQAGSALHDRILRTLADGQRFGVQGVVAGDRWAASGRAGRLMTHRYVLRFNSEVDYDSTGLRSSSIPEGMGPGRAIASDGRLHQIGVLGDGSGPGQAEALRVLAQALQGPAAAVPAARRPRSVQSLPTKVLIRDLLAEQPVPDGKVPVLVGVSAAHGGPLWLDLGVEARGFVVVGRRRTGRSTALVSMALSALEAGVSVVALCPRPSPLRDLAGEPGVVAVHSDDAAATATLAEVGELDRALVLADDVDHLDPGHGGLSALHATSHPARAIVVASSTDSAKSQVSGFLTALRRQRSGLILCPGSVYDGGALGGANLPRQLLFDQPEGRAVLSLGGDYSIVQVALAG